MERGLREKVSLINNYVVYYGSKPQAEHLREYDMLILEPSAWESKDINDYKSQGKIVIAYLSAMEISEENAMYYILKDTDFLMVEGKRAMNNEYNNHIVDISSKRWQNILIHKAGQLLLGLGFDGLFIDTLGDIEFEIFDATEKSKLLYGAKQFIESVRHSFPDSIIIQNNAISNLLDYSASLIDALCWENPPVKIENINNHQKNLINKIVFIQKKTTLKLLLLFEKEGLKSTTLDNLEWLPFYSDFNKSAAVYVSSKLYL